MTLNTSGNPYSIGKTDQQIDDDILRPVESFPTKLWYGAITVSGSLMLLFFQ